MILPLSSAPKRKNPDRHADQGSWLDLEGTQAFQRCRGKLTARVHTRCNGTQSRAVARLVEENLCHSGRSLLTGFALSTRKRKKTLQFGEQRARIVFLDVVARVLDPHPFPSREQRRAARSRVVAEDPAPCAACDEHRTADARSEGRQLGQLGEDMVVVERPPPVDLPAIAALGGSQRRVLQSIHQLVAVRLRIEEQRRRDDRFEAADVLRFVDEVTQRACRLEVDARTHVD